MDGIIQGAGSAGPGGQQRAENDHWARFAGITRDRLSETAMTPTPSLASLIVVRTLVYFGLAVFDGGEFAAAARAPRHGISKTRSYSLSRGRPAC
jgi:hypothetical protein